MQNRRIAIVTRRFWPMSGPTELAVADLAAELRRSGHDVEIVTARWEKHWPTDFFIRDTHVARLTRPGGGPWGNFRFQRAIARHLEHANIDQPFDGVIIFGAGQEVETVRRVLGGDIPVLVRIDSVDKFNPSNHQTKRSLAVASVIATDSRGISARVESIPHAPKPVLVRDVVVNETTEESHRSSVARSAARRAISDAHPILSIDGDHPLVVSCLPMLGDRGHLDLVSAWPIVLKSFRNAKLWLTGDGSFGREIWDLISRKELIYSVIMPGYFDDLSELFQAADLYVHPARDEQACSMLVRAMKSRLAVVSTLNPFTSSLIEKNKTGMVIPDANPQALAEALIHGIRNRDLCTRLGNAAMRKVAEVMPADAIANAYLEAMGLAGSVNLSEPGKQQTQP